MVAYETWGNKVSNWLMKFLILKKRHVYVNSKFCLKLSKRTISSKRKKFDHMSKCDIFLCNLNINFSYHFNYFDVLNWGLLRDNFRTLRNYCK